MAKIRLIWIPIGEGGVPLGFAGNRAIDPSGGLGNSSVVRRGGSGLASSSCGGSDELPIGIALEKSSLWKGLGLQLQIKRSHRFLETKKD